MKKSILKSIINECISELKLTEAVHIDRAWIIKRLKEYKNSAESNNDFNNLINDISFDLDIEEDKRKISELQDHIYNSVEDINTWTEKDFVGFANELLKTF